jgi:membrane protein required for colicin V production
LFEFLNKSLTHVDWFALGLVSLGFVWGGVKGFVRELVGLVAWFMAFMLAPILSETAGSMIPLQDLSPPLRQGFGYILVFVVVLIISTAIGKLVRKLLAIIGLGLFDRILGAIFGMLGAVVVLMLMAICVNLSPFSKNPEWTGSLSAPVLADLLHFVIPLLPSNFGRFIY